MGNRKRENKGIFLVRLAGKMWTWLHARRVHWISTVDAVGTRLDGFG